MDKNSSSWGVSAYRALADADVRHVPYVPDSGLDRLIYFCNEHKKMRPVLLSSEQEGVGIAAGAWLGGERSALLMQSSGVGNCMNALSLARTCRFPLLMVVTMRGEWGEFNPWQLPMGQTAEIHLQTCGVITRRVDSLEATEEAIAGAASLAFRTMSTTAVLIAQHVIGAKDFARVQGKDGDGEQAGNG
ncbi:MAG: phosphonopyruvate decarboxylase [Rhodospirillaceae bacterium]|nr:phosphonopyruvate decarboxylase [Rhodospirillaceae bacterium]|tara:strand:+ start:748 stop:1314 length:567 start_codon:yes stop_codon:yes gene_type:complete